MLTWSSTHPGCKVCMCILGYGYHVRLQEPLKCFTKLARQVKLYRLCWAVTQRSEFCFMRFMTMETACTLFIPTLFKDWFVSWMFLEASASQNREIYYKFQLCDGEKYTHEPWAYGTRWKNWDWVCNSIYHSQLRHVKVLLRSWRLRSKVHIFLQSRQAWISSALPWQSETTKWCFFPCNLQPAGNAGHARISKKWNQVPVDLGNGLIWPVYVCLCWCRKDPHPCWWG